MVVIVEPLEFEFVVKPIADEETAPYVLEFTGRAMQWDDDEATEVEVGVIRGHRIDLAAARADQVDIGALMDAISPDISDFRATVFHGGICYLPGATSDSSCPQPQCDSLVYIDEVLVKPDLRGQGIGQTLMKQMSLMIDIEHALIGLKAFPLSQDYGSEREPEQIRMVKNFYEKMGFVHAGKDYMVKNADNCYAMKKRLQWRNSQSVPGDNATAG
ncbi:MAG TPA: N-acetyltransferase [Gammaproteobacteria bacterium]|nr:N-acetyltransferase [Gammaproteobacteria bacterium]